jgi:hypothetical protein
MTRRVSLSFLLTAALATYACSQSSNPAGPASAVAGSFAATADKANICHRTGSSYQLLSVPGNAIEAHRAHGDGAPGEAVPGDQYMRFDSACGPRATFDPVADYDAGWLSGSNPNGVWRYGWSTSLLSTLTLYSQNYTTMQDCSESVYRAWNEPSNNLGWTPAVIKNSGPSPCANGNVDVPVGVLTQHFGGLSGGDYSHVVFTAPFDGTFTVAMTFTGRQNGVDSDVNVVVNGTPVLMASMTANLQTVVYSSTLVLPAGSTIDFATGPGSYVGLHPGHVGLSGTISGVRASS